MNNLAAAHYEYIGPSHLHIQFPTFLIFVCATVSAHSPKLRPFFQIIDPDDYVLEQFDIDLEYSNADAWTRDNFIYYLLTNHAEDLARHGIWYELDAEAVELPNDFLVAE